MPVNHDDSEERKARIDMILADLRLTADDVRELAKQATARARQPTAESRRTVESARTARAGQNASRPRLRGSRNDKQRHSEREESRHQESRPADVFSLANALGAGRRTEVPASRPAGQNDPGDDPQRLCKTYPRSPP